MATDSTRQQPSGFAAFLWALFFFFGVVLFVFLWVHYSGPVTVYEDKRAEERIKVRVAQENEVREKLGTAAMIDAAKGVVRIPIADAKKAVITDLKAKKAGPSQVKVDPWLPMPAAFDPNAAEPPPPALTSAPQGADTIRFEQPATK